VLFLLGGFVVVTLPLVLDNGASTIQQMFPLINLSRARTSGPVPILLAQNTLRGTYAFFYASEYDMHYVVDEVFDVLSGTALCLGLVMALRQVRDLGVRLVLIWFAVTLMLTTPLYYEPWIADTRLVVAVPPAALLAALGLCSVARPLAVSLAGSAWFRSSARASGIGTGWLHPVPVGRIVHDGAFSLLVAGTLIAAVALNVQNFYVATPQLQTPTLVAMAIGAVTTNPNSTAILAGDVSNTNLCLPFDGFGVAPDRALHFQGPQLLPQCPVYPPPAPYAPGRVVVLMSQENLPHIGRCASRLAPVLTWPNKRRALYGFTFTISPDPSTTYAHRIARQLLHACPELAHLSSM
jgi:hypothetical protein